MTSVFKGSFHSADDENNQGTRPVVFDVLAPDGFTSVLPEGLRLVLNVNPSTMNFSYNKVIERIQTKGGFVEQHWGESPGMINFNGSTGGFKRLYSGLSNTTGGGIYTGGTRRESLAYDMFLDLLALFHSNGDVFDSSGEMALRGHIKITFDGGIYIGRFASFDVTEDATKPFMFTLNASFNVEREVMRVRSLPYMNEPSRATVGLGSMDVQSVSTPNGGGN